MGDYSASHSAFLMPIPLPISLFGAHSALFSAFQKKIIKF